MRSRDNGLENEQFDRINRFLVAILTYDKDKVWFHIDDVEEAQVHESVSAGGHT